MCLDGAMVRACGMSQSQDTTVPIPSGRCLTQVLLLKLLVASGSPMGGEKDCVKEDYGSRGFAWP